jgi:uncharacterized protein involved in type VI secretion and phage assembly
MNRAAYFERPAGWLSAAHLAEVQSLDDPDGLNRVQVRLIPYGVIEDQDFTVWARVVAPFAGDDRGAFFMPDVSDEVLVVFVQGDPRHALVIGGLWSGANEAPASLSGGNVIKRIRSKNGIQITLEDQQGQETLTLETPGGQTVTLTDGPGAITLEDSNGNSVKLETSGITVQASATVTVQATKVDVSAGLVNVDTALAKFSGVVKCEVLQSTAVVSTSYTPGAGNIW